ncbi:MAG: hypothetical protein LM583_06215 [Desulfurococcaceae archaeon]|nr:hypothetical protein [Desulfurococcaceae archaeon]
MHVEDLFRFIDKILGLYRISNTAVLIASAIVVFFLTLLILYKIRREHFNNTKQNTFSYRNAAFIVSAMYLWTAVLMIIGMSLSVYWYKVDIVLILGLVTYVCTLVFTVILSLALFKRSRGLSFTLLFMVSTFLYVLFFSSKVLLNGVDATETTTDTLQIYYEGCWRFSRHAGWYDLAPVDAIVKVFLLDVLGVNNPYDAVITTLMYSALAFSIVIFLFGFVKGLFNDSIKGWSVVILLMSIHPYALLIDISSPPTNFSLVFTTFAIMVISKSIYMSARTGYATLMSFVIFAISATLAHPKAIAIPAYLLTISLVISIYNPVKAGSSNIIYLSALFSMILFLVKLVFTGMSLGAKGLVDIFLKGLMMLLFIEKPVDIMVYEGSPNLPPRSTFFSFAGFIGFISAIFLIELIKLVRRRNADKITVFVMGTSLLLILAGVITNIISSSSRYLAVPGITLGSFQSIIYIGSVIKNTLHPKWRNVLVAMLGIMCLASILSPNAMIEEYNIFTGGRWPRIENFILSHYLVYNVDPRYVANVFYGWEKAKLNLYFAQDILYYGYPYHHINVLLTERFLIPGVINARSYWDFSGGRLFVKYAGYIDYEEIINESIVFNGWRWIMTW